MCNGAPEARGAQPQEGLAPQAKEGQRGSSGAVRDCSLLTLVALECARFVPYDQPVARSGPAVRAALNP